MMTIDDNLDALFDDVLPEPKPDYEPTRELTTRAPKTGRQETSQQDLFYVQEYIENGGNAFQAAITAGFSEHTAATLAPQWIRVDRESSLKPDLWDMVTAHRNKRLTHLDVTEERILQEYARMAFFDPLKLIDDDGKIKRLQDMDVDTRAAIDSTEIVTMQQFGLVLKHKLGSKTKALDSLARVKGMNKDEISVVHTMQQLLNEIEQPAADEPMVIDISGGEDHVLD